MKFTEKELEKVKKERMEQIDRYLDNEYGCSYTRLEELHDFVIEQDMKHQEEKDKEIERLNNIINELDRRFNQELENNEKWDIENTKQFYSKKWYKDTLNDFKNMIKN